MSDWIGCGNHPVGGETAEATRVSDSNGVENNNVNGNRMNESNSSGSYRSFESITGLSYHQGQGTMKTDENEVFASFSKRSGPEPIPKTNNSQMQQKRAAQPLSRNQHLGTQLPPAKRRPLASFQASASNASRLGFGGTAGQNRSSLQQQSGGMGGHVSSTSHGGLNQLQGHQSFIRNSPSRALGSSSSTSMVSTVSGQQQDFSGETLAPSMPQRPRIVLSEYEHNLALSHALDFATQHGVPPKFQQELVKANVAILKEVRVQWMQGKLSCPAAVASGQESSTTSLNGSPSTQTSGSNSLANAPSDDSFQQEQHHLARRDGISGDVSSSGLTEPANRLQPVVSTQGQERNQHGDGSFIGVHHHHRHQLQQQQSLLGEGTGDTSFVADAVAKGKYAIGTLQEVTARLLAWVQDPTAGHKIKGLEGVIVLDSINRLEGMNAFHLLLLLKELHDGGLGDNPSFRNNCVQKDKSPVSSLCLRKFCSGESWYNKYHSHALGLDWDVLTKKGGPATIVRGKTTSNNKVLQIRLATLLDVANDMDMSALKEVCLD